MKSTEFCYWLQGFFELSDLKDLTLKQVECIKNHLNLVFLHEIDPSYGGDNKVYQKIHDRVESYFDELKDEPKMRC